MTVMRPGRISLTYANQLLDNATAIQTIGWAVDHFGDGLVMSSSFGIQAAVMLHLVTQVKPDIPVIWIDTGYLPTETYHFAESLQRLLNLNLKTYQSTMSPARMEALYGKLWDRDDVASLNRYDEIRKVEPMQRALRELGSSALIAGLRADQTKHRQNLRPIEKEGDCYRIFPILGWSSRDVNEYLTVNNLPYHPYINLGYKTVGDWHSSRPKSPDDDHERATRFRGLKQECGLHIPYSGDDSEIPD